ncbi:MAG: acetolactate synthase large subunit [Desulfopila sp.]|jgi:acetolactate synthase-1/2/3 large subunit|nr:acetolactate synthase large subunit [Desulfopila sp.]
MEKMNGAELIIRMLEHRGITTIAGIPGGANLPLYNALRTSSTIKHILCRHEQGAGFIAQGMARSTGRPGVCFATSGPGATNIITAIADAYLDSVPLLCITGQVPKTLIGTDAFQEVDTYGMSIPITKHNFLIRSAAEIPQTINRAFAIATQGRPGPVLIDVPKDVQQEVLEFDSYDEPEPPPMPMPCATDKIRLAADMINSAARPILYLGGGVINSGAGDLALRLLEKSSLPTTMTLMGLGAISTRHPNALGMLGMHAARSTNMALEECDLLIAAGVRFDDRATGKISEFCPNADVIHMDIDPSEVHKLRRANVALIGDLACCLEDLLPFIKEQQRQQWRERINELQKMYPLTIPESLVPQKPYGLIRKVAALAGDEAIITTDVGKHQMWTAQVYPFCRPRQFLTSGGLGTMGFGLPAAIGAALANPDRLVICFSGDGSLQMNIQELATAVEQKLNVKIIVLNNNSLGLVHQQQGLFYDNNFFASDYTIDIDFATIARGFGMQSVDFRYSPLSGELLQDALSAPGPCLINVPIDKNEEVYPMVPPGAANRTMIGGYNAKLKN